jgi:Zinc finger C-x8-C-x5-C-x3-H type (and similar)
MPIHDFDIKEVARKEANFQASYAMCAQTLQAPVFIPHTSKVSTVDTYIEVEQVSQESKFKTEMCRNYDFYGFCHFGPACNYAHGRQELREKFDLPVGYKTKLCKNFHKSGSCPYGQRCQFIHEKKDGMISDSISISSYS